jgi:aldehyde:ferredoxin oxidoreductase
MFPAYLKLAGFYGLVITGKAKEPVWLQLKAGESKILSASDLWGFDVFIAEERLKGPWTETSTLTIGPAGEKGHPWSTLVIDRFINTGAGLGSDFGRKYLKAVAVEASGEMTNEAGAGALYAAAKGYIQQQKNCISSGETRRSCLGCVQGCGLYRTEEGVAFFAEELERLQGLLPQLTWDQVHYFYQKCLRQGLQFCMSDQSVGAEVSGWNLQEVLDHFPRYPEDLPAGCLNTRSWEEAQLNVHRWYSDEAFRRVDTVSGLVQVENLAMVKNCLTCCERWSMSLEEMALFLNKIGVGAYTPDDLLRLGERIIRQTMAFYHNLHYEEIDGEWLRPCAQLLPYILRKHHRDYLRLRGWEEMGYPQ